MTSGFTTLPGPSRFADEIATEMRGGRSVAVVRPAATTLSGLRSVVRERVDRDWMDVDCSALGSSGSIAQRLHRHCALPGDPADASVDTLASALDGQAIWLLPGRSEDSPALMNLVSRLADRRSRRGHGPVICLSGTLAELDPLPVGGEPGLVVLWWWGRLTGLDTRVIADAALPRRRVLGDLEVISELAAFALDVADRLAGAWTGNPAEDLRHVLPRATGQVPMEEIRKELTLSAAPPLALREAWDLGLVDWWGDHVAVHPACLLEDEAALRRRVWRGQLVSVLPFVEVRRHMLATWVAGRRRLLKRPRTEEELISAECGELLHIIRVEAELRKSRTALLLAEALRDARNALAHLEPLDREWIVRNEQLLSTRSLL